ncbi:snare associated Golgi protein-domain-containing protein [Mycena albidolilacea]|uniref:Snare associated Golgi protein-domain-containing protein n=1 Tax=Mycena albidolilacea TaxID=1033008 RepID=A0AAD7AUQ9_9AGAR|nr:snare associated Golgi protein-domain-containing protein [Mycena albidolilacea]
MPSSKPARLTKQPPRPLSVFTRRVPTISDAPPSPMYLVAARILEWTHLSPHPTTAAHLDEDLVLPLATAIHEKGPSFQSHQRFSSAHVPIIFVILLLPLSTALVLFALTTLPITVSWPHTITDLAQLGRELHGYSQSGPAQMAHVIGVMAISAIWKHAWSIPGSVVWNVLGGALFSPALATILLAALTTIGSACATLLAMPLGPLITRFFPKALELTRHALEGDSDASPVPSGAEEKNKPRSSAWVRLSVLRLIGVVPWSGINIACGVCGVSIWDCMLGSFIGVLPWTAVTCQIGDILQTVASHPSPTPQTVSSLLTSPAIIVKLVLLSFLSLAPILGRDYLRALIAHGVETPTVDASTEETRTPRWGVAWVRTKMRIASRSRTREASQHQLDVLVDEKRAIEDLSS